MAASYTPLLKALISTAFWGRSKFDRFPPARELGLHDITFG